MKELWIEKNKSESIKLSLNIFKEKELLDIRIFYYDKNEDAYKPSKKGISIPLEKIDEFNEKLNKILDKDNIEE